MAVHGIIVAAGSGSRFGGDTPKQLLTLRDRPVLAWSLRAFINAGVESLVVVAAADRISDVETILADHAPTATVVTGGATRSESVRRGIASAVADADDLVLIHDAARPLVTSRLITDVAKALRRSDAATAAIRSADTMVAADSDAMGESIDRTVVRRVQTPQGFRASVILEAHRMADAAGDMDATDDAGLVRRYLGIEVALIAGDEENLKITTEADLTVADALLSRRFGPSEQPQHR